MNNIVPPDAMEFEDKKDTKSSLPQTPVYDIFAPQVTHPDDWMQPYLEELTNNTGELLNKLRITNVDLKKILKARMAKSLLLRPSNSPSNRQITFTPIGYLEFRTLVSDIYDPILTQTGILEEITEDYLTNGFAKFVKYFPEFSEIRQLTQTQTYEATSNDWEGIYMISRDKIASRAFFAGLYQTINASNICSPAIKYGKPAKLKDVLAHAKKLQLVSRVKEFMDDYEAIQ